MANIESPVSQLKINELTKTQFESASDLSETELYAVDPEFTGGKILKTDNDGNIVESTLSEDNVGTVKSVNNVQPIDGNVTLTMPTYIHEQGVASAVWTVQHNLNKYPSVTVVDSSENVIIADVEYIDANTVKITMKGASKGRAYLN